MSNAKSGMSYLTCVCLWYSYTCVYLCRCFQIDGSPGRLTRSHSQWCEFCMPCLCVKKHYWFRHTLKRHCNLHLAGRVLVFFLPRLQRYSDVFFLLLQGLLLLQQLTKSNAAIQKIVAFENAFERLLDIITEEGSSDGGKKISAFVMQQWLKWSHVALIFPFECYFVFCGLCKTNTHDAAICTLLMDLSKVVIFIYLFIWFRENLLCKAVM